MTVSSFADRRIRRLVLFSPGCAGGRTASCLLLFSLLLAQLISFAPAFGQSKVVQLSNATAQYNDGVLISPDGRQTQDTVPNKYEDAMGNLYRVSDAANTNQRNINVGVNRILTGEYAPNVFQAGTTTLALQAAEQGQQKDVQMAANNILNASLGSINPTYRGLVQFYKDSIVGNLFQNIGQLFGKWLSEFTGGWVADTAQFLAKFLSIFVLNPNVAVNGLNGSPSDGISPWIRQGADVMYGIAVDLLLLLFILCIWKYWADAAWGGAGNLMAPVGRLIFTAGLLLAWPTIYAFEIQISNEMIRAICANNPEQVLMLDYALAQVVKGGVIAAGAGAFSVFAPVIGKFVFPIGGEFAGNLFYFASTLVFTILGGIIIAEIVYLLVLKAIQTALLTAQYMFAPIFLVFFATPDTESYATGYVRAFVETSLWTFVWVGLLKILTIVLFSDYNPWGKALIAIGVLQIMIQVPSFLGRAQISPMSDFISAGLVFGTFNKALDGLRGMTTSLASTGVSWFASDRFMDKGLQQTKLVGMSGFVDKPKDPELLNSLNKASELGRNQYAQKGIVGGQLFQGPQRKSSVNTAIAPDVSTAKGDLQVLGNMAVNKSTAALAENALADPPEQNQMPLHQKYTWSKPAAHAWNEQNLIHSDTRKLLSKLTSADGVGLSVGQPKTSALGSISNGVQRINIAAGASDTEMTHAIYAASFANNIATDDPAKDAARSAAMQSKSQQPQGLLENLCANWLSNTGSTWSKTALAKQRFQQTMFEQAVLGSQSYVSRHQGNAYTEYLRARYGEWGDVQDAEAVHLISNSDSSESPWNRNVGPATDALVASGIPIDKDTRAAMQNLSIQSMHPARRKQAVFAALSYTYRDAKLLHADQDSPVFKLTHGELARSLSPDQINNALAVFQLSGQDDLCSSCTPQYMKATSAIAEAAQIDFGTAYARMASAAPSVARQLGYLDSDLPIVSIKSYSDLAQNVLPRQSESIQDAMENILKETGSVLWQNASAFSNGPGAPCRSAGGSPASTPPFRSLDQASLGSRS